MFKLSEDLIENIYGAVINFMAFLFYMWFASIITFFNFLMLGSVLLVIISTWDIPYPNAYGFVVLAMSGLGGLVLALPSFYLSRAIIEIALSNIMD